MTPDKRERAIKYLTEEIRSLRMAPEINGCPMTPEWADQLEIMEACLEAVRACHIGEATDMVPLPLEQLMGMEKPTPVWAEVENKTIEGWGGYWCLCVRGHILTPSLISMYAEKMEGVKFYSHHPAHIDREAWEPCGNCKPSCGNCIDGYEDEEDYPLTCQCCVNHNNYRPKDNYCSACGRPLKSEAWAELEKRLRG